MPFGEIDVIAKDGSFLVFVEIRTKRSDHYGSPQESITRGKQRRMIRAAQAYLKAKRLIDQSARFDVLGINLDQSDRARFHLIKNAVELGGEY
jgi:putative endonuclease